MPILYNFHIYLATFHTIFGTNILIQCPVPVPVFYMFFVSQIIHIKRSPNAKKDTKIYFGIFVIFASGNHRKRKPTQGTNIMKSSSMDSLSMLLDSVKILYIGMFSYDLNIIIGLLRCFQCLENLYIKVMISCTLKARIYCTRINRSAVALSTYSFSDLNCFQSSCLLTH